VLAVYAAALATLAASVVVGHALRLVCGFPRSRWLAPPVGLGTVLAVAAAAIELGGGATFVLTLLAALLAVSLAIAAVRRSESPLGWEAAPVVVVVLLLLALPFAASGRVDVLGMGNSNDMVDHLTGAYWLETREGIVPRVVVYGYPLGPHALAAALAGIGLPLPAAFTGIMFACPALAALAALAALPRGGRLLRWWAALLVGVPYLVASYFGQSEFNEVILAVFVLTFALLVRELVGERGRWPLRAAAPLGLLGAGMVSAYSYLGLVWPLTLVGFLFAIQLARARPSRADTARRIAARAAPVAIAAALVLAASAGAQASRIARFADAPYANTPRDRMGNLIDPISPLTVLGVWPAGDVRVRPVDEATAVIGGTVALAAFVLALLWWARRREAVMLAAVAACAVIYAQATLVKNPYASAKALPVAAPVVALVLAVPWMNARRTRRAAEDRRARRRAGVIVAAGTLVAVAATASSALALRDAYVGTSAHGDALETFRPFVGGDTTLFLGYDDFAHWRLRGAELATVGHLYARWVAPLRPEKQWAPGHAFDFDSVSPAMLDAVRYVVTPRSTYASTPPANFTLRRQDRWFQLWERAGRTPSRVLAASEIGAPGGVLDCAAERIEPSANGVAAVLPPPIVRPASAWRGSPENAGEAATQVLELPAGRWDVSLQYASRRPLRVEVLDLRARMPANLARLGPHWLVGTIDVPRPARARVTVASEYTRVAEALGADARTRAYGSPERRPLGELVATRHAWRPRLVPLAEACGRYVDWYTRSSA
jgi:hypothetical protein